MTFGSKSLGHGFWTIYDIIVAIATACATMATLWVCGSVDAESCDNVETVAQSGIGIKIAWRWFFDNVWHHYCHSNGLYHRGNPLGWWKIWCQIMWQSWNCGTKENRGSKLLGHGFSTIYDIIVAIVTACATMATDWVFGEFDAELCGGVKSMAQSGIGS